MSGTWQMQPNGPLIEHNGLPFSRKSTTIHVVVFNGHRGAFCRRRKGQSVKLTAACVGYENDWSFIFMRVTSRITLAFFLDFDYDLLKNLITNSSLPIKWMKTFLETCKCRQETKRLMGLASCWWLLWGNTLLSRFVFWRYLFRSFATLVCWK